MRRYRIFAVAIVLILLSTRLPAQAVFYDVDFSSGSGPWSIHYPSDQGQFSVSNGLLRAYDMDAEGEWMSDEILIEGVEYAQITMSITWRGSILFSNPDYIRVYFKIDGGEEVLMFEKVISSLWETAEGSAAISKVIKGNTVQIIVRTFSDTVLGLAYNEFDDIRVSEVVALYSRSSGQWSSGANWSFQPFTEKQDPAGVYPNIEYGAIIGNGNTINVTGAEETAFLEIHDRGMLSLNRNTLRLRRGGGLTVRSGGKIQDNNPNSVLEFADPYKTNMTVNATTGININQLVIAGDSKLNIMGNGSATVRNLSFTGAGSEAVVSIDLQVNGNLHSSGQDNRLINQKTLSLTGDLSTNNNRFYLHNESGATVNWSGTGAGVNFRLHAAGPFSTFQYSGNAAQSIIIPQDAYHHLALSGSGVKSLNGNIAVVGNLSVSGAARLRMMNASKFDLSGDWLNQSLNSNAFDEGQGTVVFNGLSDQRFSSASSETFYRLQVDKAGGRLILDNTIQIANSLAFLSGIIEPSAHGMVVFNNGSSCSGASEAGFVDGLVRKTGAQDFIFPIGKGSLFAPLAMSGFRNANGSTTFTARYFDVPAPYPLKKEDGLAGISKSEYWDLERTSDNGNDAECRVELFWTDKDRSGINDPYQAVIVHYNSSTSMWENAGNSGVASNSIRSNRVSSFSPFTFGDYTGLGLPVELVSFSGRQAGEKNILEWKTISEYNNDYFIVEKSLDAKKWIESGSEVGHANHTGTLVYEYIDERPFPGINYYRLKQVDYDGEYDYSRIISVTNQSIDNVLLEIAPNPTQGHARVAFISTAQNPVKLTVTTMQGILLFSKTVNPERNVVETIIDFERLPKGMYLVAAEQNGVRKVEKAVRN